MSKERLDKAISTQLNLTRSQARRLIKIGVVCIDKKACVDPCLKVDPDSQSISVNGKKIDYNKYIYIMMNKPMGVISASKGNNYPTVIDILPDEMKRKDLFPAGRLDKDTTGFMLITDDGEFAHSILSPKRHVKKTYEAVLDKCVSDEIISAFENGLEMADGTVFEKAILTCLDNTLKNVQIVITQGKYHQIKRMFLRFGINVTALNRSKIGNLALDENLEAGQCRFLSMSEKAKICE